MKASVSRLLAVTCLATAALVGVLAAPCTGGIRDTAYCADESNAAHKVTSCPRICKKSKCRNKNPAKVERNGAYVDGADTMNWEEITRTGMYDHVYVEDERICLGSCWYLPWAAKCERWEEAEGKEYCGHLNCEHDDADSDDLEDGGNRYSGCHAAMQDGVLGLKLDWHEPTCNQCIRLFPQACYDDLKAYASNEDDKAVSYREERLEAEIREFCYSGYFGHLMEAESSSSSSSSRRKLFSSSEEDSGLIGPSFKRQVQEWVEEEVLWMASNGKIECPAAQCLTQDQDLLALYARFPEPQPVGQIKTALSNPTLKWYHNIEGFCNWNNCETGPEGGMWCNAGVDQCMRCNGAWCPLKAAGIPLPPVTQEKYFPLPDPAPQDPWYLSTGKGYCSYQSCDGKSDYGPWCNTNYDNCHKCYGLWCPPSDKTEKWEPISRNGVSQEITVAGGEVLVGGKAFQKLSFEVQTEGRRLSQTLSGTFPSWMEKLLDLSDTSSCPMSITDLSSEQVDNVDWLLPTRGKLITASPEWGL